MDIAPFMSAALASWLPILVYVLIFVSFAFGLWIAALHDFPLVPAISFFVVGELTSSDFPVVLLKGFLFPTFMGIVLGYSLKWLIRKTLGIV